MTPDFERIDVGHELPSLVFGPITRLTLALFCGGSGDHHPVHVDIDCARRAGHDDVFAHGMLSMAVLARLLTNWVPQRQIREYGVRFKAITPVNATVRCRGVVVEKLHADGEPRLRLDLAAEIDDGSVTVAGSATVALPTVQEPKAYG